MLTNCNYLLTGPLQLLKIVLNELIVHEMEMIINEKTSYQMIYGQEELQNLTQVLLGVLNASDSKLYFRAQIH